MCEIRETREPSHCVIQEPMQLITAMCAMNIIKFLKNIHNY